MKLSDIAEFITDKISSSSISLDSYVTTDSLLQNKRGRELAQNLPPMQCALTNYKKGDVLVANIRPYLKKVWFADSEGGCSSDVLVFRAKNGHYPSFLYAILMQDAFFDYAMLGAKGSKMPRGDKNQIMRYELPTFTSAEEENIGNIMVDIISKINVNRQINDNLEAMAKQLYNYWFVQFDFPNEEGKPYKSSGGAMVWNEKLKREIPKGWSCESLQNICSIKRGASPRPIDEYMDSSCNGMPWVKISDATVSSSPFLTQIKECIIQEGVSKSVRVIPNTLIVSNSATPGIPKFIQLEACVHDGWLVVTNYNEVFTYYLYYVIKMIRQNLLHMASGSIFKNLKTDYLKEFICIIPHMNILELYHKKVEKIMKQILNHQNNTEELTKLRDELLPLLMNGQAVVNSD